MKANPAQRFIDLLVECAKQAPPNANYLTYPGGAPQCAYGLAFVALGMRLPKEQTVGVHSFVRYTLIPDKRVDDNHDMMDVASSNSSFFNATKAEAAWNGLTNAQARDYLT